MVVPMPIARPSTAATSGFDAGRQRSQEIVDLGVALAAFGDGDEVLDVVAGRERSGNAADQHRPDGVIGLARLRARRPSPGTSPG